MLIDLVSQRLRSAADVVAGGLRPRARKAQINALERRVRAAEADLALLANDIRGLDLVVAQAGQYALAGVVVERTTAQEEFDRNLRTVAERLEAAGITYWLVFSGIGRRAIVGVSASDRPRALSALDRPFDDQACYLAPVDRLRILEPVPLGHGLPGEWDTHPVLRLFAVTAAAGGQLVAGPEEGCDLEFWDEVDGVLVAPRKNIYAMELRGADREPCQITRADRSYPSYAPFAVDHGFDVSFPIDAVYTWVDGGDPAWRERKERTLRAGTTEGINEIAAHESRYTSSDELKYSFRSLDRYAGWIRHVYLVTDDQVPDWLDTTNERVTVVSHREIFGDEGQLPTFNSHAIESKLHRIVGLSEHFLYINDDVLFGRPVAPNLFFHGNGAHKFFPSPALFGPGPVREDDLPVDAAGKNNRDLLFSTYGKTMTAKFKHAPHALQRSLLELVEQKYPEAVGRTARAQFRHPDDIAMISLAHYVAWFTQQATAGRIRYEYVNMSGPEAAGRLDALLAAHDSDAFCLNDTQTEQEDYATQTALLQRFLEAYFPLPSSFERTGLPAETSLPAETGRASDPQ